MIIILDIVIQINLPQQHFIAALRCILNIWTTIPQNRRILLSLKWYNLTLIKMSRTNFEHK